MLLLPFLLLVHYPTTMAPATRSRVLSDAIKTAIMNVFVYSPEEYQTSRYSRILEYNEISQPFDLMMLSESQIFDLSAPKSSEDTTEIKLSPTEARRLIHLRAWAKAQPSPNTDMWFTVTNESFGAFLSDASNQTVQTTTDTSNSTTANLAEKFKSGIKRSITDYPKLADDKFWRSFKQKFLSLAASHDIGDVFDPSYAPSSAVDIELFKARQTFAWSVLVHCFHTGKSRAVIQRFDHTNDAQAAFKEILKTYETGTATDIYEDNLLATIDNMVLDSKWKKPLETFFTRWTLKVLEYEDIKGKPFDDETKVLKLIKAVRQYAPLYNVVTQSKITFASISGALPSTGTNAPRLTFDYLYRSILDTAIQLDSNNKALRIANKTNRITPPSKPTTSTNDKDKDPRPRRINHPIPPHLWKKMTPDERVKALEEHRRKRYTANLTNTAPTTEPPVVANPPSNPPTTQDPNVPGSTLRRMMSNYTSQQPAPSSELTINGVTYVVKATRVKYSVHLVNAEAKGSLIDGGANGGMSGNDVRIVSESYTRADVTGIADSEIHDVPICTVAGVIETTTGPIIGIFNQYAHYGKGSTIHSVNQLVDFGIDVNDRPLRCQNGRQTIVTPEGYTIPLAIRNGLAYMDMHPPSDKEFDSLPHVIFTSDVPWDPSSLDHEWDDSLSNLPDLIPRPNFRDEDSDDDDDSPYDTWTLNTVRETYRDEVRRDVAETSDDGETVRTSNISTPKDSTTTPKSAEASLTTVPYYTPRSVLPKHPDYAALRPYFAWIPASRVRDTIESTTQWYRAEGRVPMRRHFKSRFPAANVRRLNEEVAMDTIFSNTPALDDGVMGHGGCRMMQIFTGVTSHITEGFPLHSESDIHETVEAFITKHGAPTNLRSDNARAQIGKKVQDILRHLFIGFGTSDEPEQQNQNPAERRIQDIKKMTNSVMDRTATPANLWLLCTIYVIYVLNRITHPGIGNIPPLEKAYGQKVDTSPLLHFKWREPVYYLVHDASFPDTREALGYFVGFAESCGDVLTFNILNPETNRLLPRSAVRSAVQSPNPNYRVLSLPGSGEASEDIIDLSSDDNTTSHSHVLTLDDLDPTSHDPEVKIPRFSPDELVGKTFTMPSGDDDRLYRATVIRKVEDLDAADHQRIKFLVEFGHNNHEAIIAYNQLCDYIEDQEENQDDKAWTFKGIIGHQGPLKAKDPAYKGSKWNLKIDWDDDEPTWEPLTVIAKDDIVSVAKYGKAHGLLDEPGWKHIKRIANRPLMLKRMVCQVKKKRKGPIFKFGVQVPRNPKEAAELDLKYNQTKWADAQKTELDQLDEYGTFKSIGKGTAPPPGYKKIIVSWVYDVKQDLRHKARCVSGGHLTPPSSEDAYSGVVSLRSVRLALLLGELNGLKPMVGDIGNAYLEAYTKEKVYFIAGPEFGELEGHTMLVVKAHYGLRTSGARFHERLYDTLRDMGFTPCKADPDLWMRDAGDCYEYVCVYVDDLLAVMKDPRAFFDTLTNNYGYKLKGVGEPSYHLGGDFYRDPDGTLVWGAHTYIQRMCDNYKHMFNVEPRNYSSPMEHGDSPELDESPELDSLGVKQYQSLIGALQWCVTLGRFDIYAAVMTMSRFRAAPREGHLDRAKRIIGYLKATPAGGIRFRTSTPVHEPYFNMPEHDWMYSVYGNISEELPDDLPTPKGKPVRTTTFLDANLMFCKATGRSASGILHFVLATPIDWYSKRQSTVETATYGSEFVAARTGTDQIVDIRTTIRYMGAPLDGISWMFGDNRSVVTSSTVPSSMLSKRHLALSYHRVREAIAAKIIKFCHIDGRDNVADVMTKFLPRPSFWPLIEPVLFWRGETQVKKKNNTPTST